MAWGFMGLVESKGKWTKPETVAESMKAYVTRADPLVESNGPRVKTPLTEAGAASRCRVDQ